MTKYLLSAAADQDLFQIYAYNRKQFGATQAERYLNDLEDCFKKLARFPNLGRPIDHIRTGYFRFEHEHHSIFYRLTDDDVFIIRVLHNMRDIEAQL